MFFSQARLAASLKFTGRTVAVGNLESTKPACEKNMISREYTTPNLRRLTLALFLNLQQN